MKRYTKLLSAAFALSALPLLFACTENPWEPETDQVAVTPRFVTLKVGQAIQFQAIVRPESMREQAVEWSSSDPKVADLEDGSGLVMAFAPGNAVIRADCGIYGGTAIVEVIDSGGEPEEKPGGER